MQRRKTIRTRVAIDAAALRREAKAGVQDCLQEGGEQGSFIWLNPFAGMNMRPGMKEKCSGWGRSTTFITPVYPCLASCSQKSAACKGAHLHQWELVAWLDTGGSADKVWSWEQERTPATHHHHPLPLAPGIWPRKGGLFSEVLSFLRSRTLCQVGPRVIRRALLVGARTEHLTRPVHTAPPAPLLCLRLERGEKTGH